MDRFKFYIVILTVTSLISCNSKTEIINKKSNIQSKPEYVMNNDLSLKDYSDINGYFPKEGLIPTAEIAFKVVEPILKQIYGSEKIDNEKPFSINLENDIWIIEGHLDVGLLGGVAYVEIRKNNGEILKVIHTK